MILWCQGLLFDWSYQLYKPSEKSEATADWLCISLIFLSSLQCPNFLMCEDNAVFIKKGILRNLSNWVVLSEVHPCACELLGCMNGEELKWGNAGFFVLFCLIFFFLRIPFLSFGIDFVGQGCILTLLFHHEYISKSYWNMWCHFRSWRGGRGMLFWDFSCFSLGLMLFLAVHLPCSTVQHKVHLVHWYFNLLKGDYVTKIKDLEKPH